MSIVPAENQALYGVRIYSTNPDMADATAKQFVSTVKFYPKSYTLPQANVSVNSSANTSAQWSTLAET